MPEAIFKKKKEERAKERSGGKKREIEKERKKCPRSTRVLSRVHKKAAKKGASKLEFANSSFRTPPSITEKR